MKCDMNMGENRSGQALKGLSLAYDEFFRPESDL